MISDKIRGHASIFLANTLWGGMSPMCKSLMMGGIITSSSLTSFRFIGGAVCCWLFSLLLPKEKIRRQDYWRIFLASLFAITLNQGFFIVGISLSSPIDASVIASLAPAITMVLAAIFLKNPITWVKALGVLLGAVGAIVLVLDNNGLQTIEAQNHMFGDLLCLCAEIGASVYFVMFQGLINRYSPITLMKWMFLFACITTLPFTGLDIISTNYLALNIFDYSQIGYIAIIATFLCYILLPVAQRILPPTTVSIYCYVQPVVATTLAIFTGIGTMSLQKGLAMILIFISLYIVTQARVNPHWRTAIKD